MKKFQTEELTFMRKGGTGLIYRIDEERVLKIYSNNMSLEDLEEKKQAMRSLIAKGIPAMITFDIAEVDSRYGIVLEMLRNLSVGKTIMNNPSRLDEMGMKMGKLLRMLHNTDVSDCLPSFHHRIEGWIDTLEQKGDISKHCARNMRELVKKIPEKGSLIHSDFHEGNVKVYNDELVLIDLDEVSYGNPLYDLAFHYINHVMISGSKDVCMQSVGMEPSFCKAIYDKELDSYFGGNVDPKIKKKILPISLMLMALTPARLDTEYLKKSSYRIKLKVISIFFDMYATYFLKKNPDIYKE